MSTSQPQAIFSPIKVGKNQLQHRIVLAPLTRFRATPSGVPTDLQAEYYQQRATEGGLLIAEATRISAYGAYPNAPGIYTREQIEGWKKTTAAVHEKKGTIFLQLWHIGRAGSKNINPNNEQVVSASAIGINGKSFVTGEDHEVPRALEIEEIKAIIEQYRQAALNAIEAGFDGVEIHSSFGYLLDQFINSSSNKRTDIYGGSIENRTRFTLEVVDAVTKAIGEDRTGIRLSPGEDSQGAQDDTPIETWGYLTSAIQNNYPNMAYLHFTQVSFNGLWSEKKVAPPDTVAPFRKLWKGPFIVANGYSTIPEAAIELSEKNGDLIAFGRTFIANPDLVERLRNGRELNPYDRSTFYAQGAAGYTDYPFYSESKH